MCSSQEGAHGCLEWPIDRESVPFHHLFGHGVVELAELGGPGLSEIVARPVEAPTLGEYVPQVEIGSRVSTRHTYPTYGVRIDQILTTAYVRSSADIRAICGIPDDASLVLFCFSYDRVLEKLWSAESVARAIAVGGWDLVTAPSYSLWFDRPRSFHFHSRKRSFDVFGALLDLGAPAIPRVAFIDEADVDFLADWCNQNPDAALLSIDAMTRKTDEDWIEHFALLDRFDQRTGHERKYLINGTGAIPRLKLLYELLGIERVTFSDATWAGPPPGFGDPDELSTSMISSDWELRLAERQRAITVAKHAAIRSAAP